VSKNSQQEKEKLINSQKQIDNHINIYIKTLEKVQNENTNKKEFE